MNLLLAEDDESVARFIRQALTEEGYTVERVADGLKAFELARRGTFDAILLDLMLPTLDGLTVCEKLREAHITTPILMVTARDTLGDRVTGLDKGADDYLPKPFEIAELLARVRALLRRGNTTSSPLVVADLTLDPVTRRATRAGQPISLSATEFLLLEYLVRNAGRVLSRKMIVDYVWQYDSKGNDNVLDVYISYLRAKVDKGHVTALIHTVRGVGYVLGIRERE